MEEFSVSSKTVKWLTSPAFSTKKRLTRIVVVDNVSFYNTFWDGGSKNTYKGVKLSDGEVCSLETGPAPWLSIAEGRTVSLEPGYAIVEETIFQGKVMKLSVYLHPDNAVSFLPSSNG